MSDVMIKFTHLHKGQYVAELDSEISPFYSGHNPPGKRTMSFDLDDDQTIVIDLPMLNHRITISKGSFVVSPIPGIPISVSGSNII